MPWLCRATTAALPTATSAYRARESVIPRRNRRQKWNGAGFIPCPRLEGKGGEQARRSSAEFMEVESKVKASGAGRANLLAGALRPEGWTRAPGATPVTADPYDSLKARL